MSHSCQEGFSRDSQRQSVLLQSLSQGMHDVAQPLAILQGKLELAVIKGGDAANYLAAIEESLGEARRVIELFSYLRELVRIARDDEPRSGVEIGALVRAAAEDAGHIARASGVEFQLECPERLPLIRVSAARVRQALFYALQAVQGISRTPDTVLLAVELKGSTVEVYIANHSQSMCAETVGREFKRAISLTKAIIENQEASFDYDPAPFALTIGFPAVGYQDTSSGSACYERNE